MNLLIRMWLRRFTLATNDFSKKFENHCHALALYFVWYNFCRQHKSLGGISPAMAAGFSDTLHDMEWIVSLIDERAPKPGPRVPYKKGPNSYGECVYLTLFVFPPPPCTPASSAWNEARGISPFTPTASTSMTPNPHASCKIQIRGFNARFYGNTGLHKADDIRFFR